MTFTVDNVQSRVAAVLDQDQDTSNISSTDYSLRLEYINRRERTWSEVGKWETLYSEYNTQTSTVSGNTSVAMPAGFRRLAARPRITYDSSNTKEFVEIRGQEEARFDKTSTRYVKMLGNPSDGYNMVVNSTNSSQQLVSGASIFVPYFKSPASLASPTNAVTCPNPEYLVQGVIADMWESRGDERFPQAKVDADRILQNMLEQEFSPTEAAYNDVVKTQDESRFAFRWGRD